MARLPHIVHKRKKSKIMGKPAVISLSLPFIPSAH